MATKYIYQEAVCHDGLNKYRVVKAETQYELDQKKNALLAQWNEQWEKKVARETRIKNDLDSLAYANELTQEAEDMQVALDNILLNSLNPQSLDLNRLRDFSKFSEAYPERPFLVASPIKPELYNSKYNQKPSFFAKISRRKMAEHADTIAAEYAKDLEAWEVEKATIEETNNKREQKYSSSVEKWEAKRRKFEKKQVEENEKVDLFFEQYVAGNPESVERYFLLVLEGIEFPFEWDRSIEVEYDPLGKTLIVDVVLPLVSDIPNLKSVSYIKTRRELKESYHSESYIKKKYDCVLYQIVLQIMNYVFTLSHEHAIIDSVVVNGKIITIDKSTGQDIEPYVLSVSVSRSSFEGLNLSAIDPKSWFKSSKGVAAASLANTVPVAPIVTMTKEDKRFVDGYSVSEHMDDSVNLAAIDWQDFENLIREIFEKEFKTNGGEVKITQASRDGGVDAVAFDPDPIRGGKIVIQAKRYTNVVSVSAVRDLYGTVMNEGAMKGILVTTSNYGNDAYTFAKGKPITLMNGGNLLHLLESHGHKARIDLKEAKEFLRG